MNGRTTLVLLLVVLLVGGFIYFLEMPSESTEDRMEAAKRAFRVNPSQITFLNIQRDDGQVTCRKMDGGWELIRPVLAPAAAGTVNQVLYALEGLARGEVITAKQRRERGLSLKDYGLDNPRISLTWGQRTSRQTLLIGRESPLGQGVYVKFKDQEDILALPDAFLDDMPEDFDEWRERVVFDADRARVRRLGIRRKDGYIQIARDGAGNWMIQQPFEARAERQEILKLIEILFTLRVEDFVADEVADFAPYGLGDAEMEVTLWANGDEGGKTLMIGQPAEGQADFVYARWEDGTSVFTLPAAVEPLLNVQLKDLRERRLLPRTIVDADRIVISNREASIVMELGEDKQWNLIEPRQDDADTLRVRELIQGWSEIDVTRFFKDENIVTNREAFGFGEDALTIVFKSPVDDQDVSIQVSTVRPESGQLLVAVTGENGYYVIPDSAMGVTSTDPVFFRDRQMLALFSSNVRSVRQRRGESVLEVRRENGDADYQVVQPVGGRLDTLALDHLLNAISALRATELIVEDPESLAEYGLEEPSMEITLGLSGDSGIRKSILLGAATEAGNRYAMIRGQDIVFTLSPQAVAQLTADLVDVPEPVAAPEEAAEE